VGRHFKGKRHEFESISYQASKLAVTHPITPDRTRWASNRNSWATSGIYWNEMGITDQTGSSGTK